MWERDETTLWQGGNRKLVDVRGDGLTIDAKVGFVHDVLLGGDEKVSALGYMGSNRPAPEVRAGVSHYGIGVVTGSTDVTVAGQSIQVEGNLSVDRYLIPAEVINGDFSRKHIRAGGTGAGFNRYLPLDLARQFLVP
ncbi:hypothetical protein SAMN06296010_1213 [Agreia pratensis]|uniref:Uncharacterized protein n=2 Tax=Agreia pratensis TaxID=150121 RepID=A0A1X7JC68_9MICO|nr:hypothetical protein SAMN06296010_1213 [Agreia pratensis]